MASLFVKSRFTILSFSYREYSMVNYNFNKTGVSKSIQIVYLFTPNLGFIYTFVSFAIKTIYVINEEDKVGIHKRLTRLTQIAI